MENKFICCAVIVAHRHRMFCNDQSEWGDDGAGAMTVDGPSEKPFDGQGDHSSRPTRIDPVFFIDTNGLHAFCINCSFSELVT